MAVTATRGSLTGCAILFGIAVSAVLCRAQAPPSTEGETLSGHGVVLAEAVRGHASLLIATFSKDAGPLGDQWAKAARADPALAGVSVYQAAMLQRAPGFVRSMIKSSLRKQIPAGLQDQFLVFTQDEPLWRSYFGVTADGDPYVVLLDAAGQVRWHGHGAAGNLEPLLKAALK
jgi:hypothetical protein